MPLQKHANRAASRRDNTTVIGLRVNPGLAASDRDKLVAASSLVWDVFDGCSQLVK